MTRPGGHMEQNLPDRRSAGPPDPRLGEEPPDSDETDPAVEPTSAGRQPSVADRYADLLAPLSEPQRKGIVAQLARGYFDGWQPSRQEVADLVAVERGRADPLRRYPASGKPAARQPPPPQAEQPNDPASEHESSTAQQPEPAPSNSTGKPDRGRKLLGGWERLA